MNFNLNQSIHLLERTPLLLQTLLNSLPEKMIRTNEGRNTWSPYDVIGHLIHGEKTDWMVRAKIILSDNPDKNFEPFDRFAQLNEDQSVSIVDRLSEFTTLRNQNLDELKSMNLKEHHFSLTGIHPEFGTVTLGELLATWTVHDFSHLAQISRIIVKQHTNQVGPWNNYFPLMQK